MDELKRVTAVEHLGGRVLRLTFSDAFVRELDFAGQLTGLLSSLDDDATFAQAEVDPVARTVCWPNGIDLDPDVLRGDERSSSGMQPKLVREYRLQQTP